MANFFCDEPIIAVYECMGEYEDEGNSFLDCYHDLAYHVTEGHRLVLETEHFYLSLDVRGVSKCEKTSSIKEFEQPGEWLDPCIHELEEDESPWEDEKVESPWVDYESTLFVGERLLQVENTSGYYLLHFDDFDLKVVPHVLNEEDFPGLYRADDWSYNHVYGAERHLKNKCSCGGEGELLLDFVSDYVVRCKKCKKSSWAEMTAIEAIKGWNAGDIQCDLSDITIE